MLAPWKKSYDQSRQYIKKQRHYFTNKDPYSQSYGFSSSHVWMWELAHKEGWELKNWCFQTVVLEKTLESPLDCKEIKPVNPKRNQPWIFIGRNDAKAEAAVLWFPDVKSWLIGKDPDAVKNWRKEKGTTENEMVEWHHWLNGHEFEQALGDGEGQGSLVCCSPWHCKESDTTEQLNWIELVTNNVSYLFKHLCNFILNFRYMARGLFGMAYIAEVTDKPNYWPPWVLGATSGDFRWPESLGSFISGVSRPSHFLCPSLCVCQYMNNLGSTGCGGVGNQSRLELSQLMGQQMDSQLLYSIVI